MTDLFDRCVFCEEFILSKHAAAENLLRLGETAVTRVVLWSLHSIVIVGLGALTPGYFLIIPSRHCLNIGELSETEFDDFYKLKLRIAAHIRRTYGDGGTVFFEHGVAEGCVSSGACISHAHVHALPSPGIEFRSYVPTGMEALQITSPLELRQTAQERAPYLFLEEASGEQFIFPLETGVKSQFFRRIWADSLGVPEKYDWALFPEYDNMITTVRNFRSDIVAVVRL
jgi:diadenosine tetraphosphate (Ap4A) HIT family hydrolase